MSRYSHTSLSRVISQASWLLALVCLGLSMPCAADTHQGVQAGKIFYIAPTGSDWNNGRSADKPWRSFSHAFAKMMGGDELVLLDGIYSEATGTGSITFSDQGDHSGGPRSGQIPSGRSIERPTYVHAQNPGKATVHGMLFIGRKFRKDSHIRIQGITFEGGGELYNTSYITIKDCGFHGPFGIGTNDHEDGNDHNLIEDVWIWASRERIIAINYRSRFNVWRRVIVRGDGCGQPGCQGSGNPNVGITVYDSSNISLQNVMVIDRVLAPGDAPYADFAVAQHTPGAHLFGQNEWLGTISLRAPDTAYYMEPDRNGTIDPTIRIINAIAWDARELGFNLQREGTGNVLSNLTARALGGDGVRIATYAEQGTLRNVISVDAGRYGINSRYTPDHAVVYGSQSRAYNESSCQTGCYSFDPRAGTAPALRHLVRIEPGSSLSGKGADGGDIGANVLFRYGTDNSRYGDPDFNSLTGVPLWPWPNDARIQSEMCADQETARGFCKAGSLTRYLWEYLGKPMPPEVSSAGASR